MKLAVIFNSSDSVLIASRYKYFKLIKDIYGEDAQAFDEHHFLKAKKFEPDFCVVFGSFRKTYKMPLSLNMPYILCDHDITSLYRPGESFDEHRKIRNARKIIFTSPDHQDYICDKYRYPKEKTMVLYLRPSISDLNFDPLPKLPGKNLAYAGGLLDDMQPHDKGGRFSYRCYAETFKQLIDLGWNVHLYAVRQRPAIYSQIGCVYHPKFNEGRDLYRELSQFTAGIQGFAAINSAMNYAKTCRPNKIWNYLAAGIPTIGINPGNGINLYEGKWGFELKDLEQLNDLNYMDLDIEKHRKYENIEMQADELKAFISS